MRTCLALFSAVFAVFFTIRTAGADWPQFRYDAARSAASPLTLPSELHLQWVRQLPPPTPAFPGDGRLRFDASYEPVVLGPTMFVPSMVTESVTALDTATGQQRWQFFAEAPVRFAPVAWQENVYFVSDDGYLYCLDAADGKLRWKFRGLPQDRADRTLLGSGRLMSLSPARGGPVLHDGVIYFAAGLWPAEGVFVHALDARSGDVVWSNIDSHQIPQANQDHGIAQVAGITPQGYVAVVGDKLVVPCGAQLPALLELATGKLNSYQMGWGGRDGLPKGTWFVAGSGRYLCQSGDIYDLSIPNDERFREPRGPIDFKSELYTHRLTRIRVDRTNHKDIGDFSQPVFTAEAFYENDGAIRALDLTSVKRTPREEAPIPANRQDDTFPDRFTGAFRQLWQLPSELDVHIKVGDQLFCAGPGSVAAIRIPKPGERPGILWQASLDGTPHRLLAAGGRLFVVSLEGRIHAFGAKKPEQVVKHERPIARASKLDEWSDKVTRILDATQPTGGYALVLGLKSGGLVEELIRQTDLYVIAVDPDADKVDELRRRLHESGQYGSRACVRIGQPLEFPLPPYLASLIVSEHSAELPLGALAEVVPSVFPKLRPYGGTACLAVAAGETDLPYEPPAENSWNGLSVCRSGDWLLLRRNGALPGAADWSHEEANSANTGASTDRFVKAPLGLLWFDASNQWHRKPGSAVVRISGGRVLVKAETLHAIDVFTGRQLWQATLPFAHRPTDQLIATPDAIYATGGKLCLVVDPATGEESGRIALPDGLDDAWRNVRCWGDYLVSTNGRFLLCVNRHTGKVVWRQQCNRRALSVAVGGGRVFCAELLNPRRGETECTAVKTRSFDVRSGEAIWDIASGSKVLYSEPRDLLVTANGIYQGASGRLLNTLPEPPQEIEGKPVTPIPGPLFVIGDKLLWGTVESFTVLNLTTGQPEGERTEWVRRGCTTIRASEHLITTRVRANAAYIDLDTRQATSLWNIRPACLNNLYPADGVLNVPNVLGGCTCNYTHASQAYVPMGEIARASFGTREK